MNLESLIRDFLRKHWLNVISFFALYALRFQDAQSESSFAEPRKTLITIALSLKTTLDFCRLKLDSTHLENVRTGPTRRLSIDDVYNFMTFLVSHSFIITTSALAFFNGFKYLGMIAISIEIFLDINSFMTEYFLNNGVRDDTYEWDREVAIVTGGCGAIGSAIARKLARNGTKVAALDLGGWVGDKCKQA